MEKEEIKQLEKWTRNLLRDDYDLFDLKANMDSSISLGENKTILRDKFKIFLKEELTTKDVKNQKEINEHDKLKEINKQTENIEKEFKQSLKHLENNNSILDKLYYLPKEYVKVVASKNNEIHGLILSGMAGCFPKNTLINTNKGFKPIQECNDVISFNEKTRGLEKKKCEVIPQGMKKIVKIHTELGIIECSEEHLWYVSRAGTTHLIQTKDLKDSDCLLRYKTEVKNAT